MLRLNEKTWTRGASARDKNGKICNPHSEQAIRFDLYSALRVSCFDYDHFWGELLRLKSVVSHFYDTDEPLWMWNDRVQWADVEKVVRKFN